MDKRKKRKNPEKPCEDRQTPHSLAEKMRKKTRCFYPGISNRFLRRPGRRNAYGKIRQRPRLFGGRLLEVGKINEKRGHRKNKAHRGKNRRCFGQRRRDAAKTYSAF